MRTYKEKLVRQSEILQLLLLDNLYSLSGSEKIIFQGGTALRWIYGGMRFSEDLDFFQEQASVLEIFESLEADLPRFLPGKILMEYQRNKFKHFIETVKQVTTSLLDQGLRDYLNNV